MIQYFPIVTGSLTVTGSVNVSGSITTNSTITATTLVVQTITSSISAITGSTNFGSLSSNTHTFTGSLLVSGSTHSIFGNVVLGNTSSVNASAKLEVKGDTFITPIGTTASKLHLYNNDSTNESYIYDSGSSSNSTLTFAPGGTTRMIVSSSGNVGIGGTNPGNKLHVFGATVDSEQIRVSNSTGTGYWGVGRENNTTGDLYFNSGGAVKVIFANNGLVNINNVIASSTNYKLGVSGSAYINGTNNKGIFVTDNATYASIVGLNSAISSYNPLELRASGTDYQLYLTTDGKVGINTNSPTGNLTVKTATNFNLRVDSYLSATCIASVNDAASAYAMFNIDGNVVRIQGLNTSGNVSIGTTTDFGYKLNLNGQPGCNGYTAWTNWSDSRLKDNITDLETTNILDKICIIRPVTFNYNELSGFDEATRARRISGFIAQELMEVFPDMVSTMKRDDGGEYYDTNLSNLNLYLVKAIQELNTKFEEYKATHP